LPNVNERRGIIAAALAVVAVMLSCESPMELVVEEAEAIAAVAGPAPAVARVGDFLIRASASAVRDDSDAYLMVTATGRNAMDGPISAAGVCVAQLRVRDAASSRLLWKNSAGPLASCPPPSSPPRDILSGRAFEFSGPAAYSLTRDVLGDSLREGAYAAGLLVRVNGDTLEIPAGTVRLSLDHRPPLEDPRLLRYQTATTVEGAAPRTVVTRIVATNPTDRWIDLNSGACFLHVSAFRDAARTGRPVWRSDAKPVACISILLGYRVEPGGTLGPNGFTRSFAVTDILGDSLPAGRYWFKARLEFVYDAPQGGLYDLGIEIPAGSAELALAPDPLPSERVVGGIRYRLNPAGAAASGETRLSLSMTNTGTQSVLLVEAGAGCNAQLSGYVDATRDGWYRSWPDWTAVGCALRLPPTWVDPGETRTFTIIVAPDIRAPRGRLTLTLGLSILQDPGTDSRILLAAGEASPGG
jgi:hypothetical protein